MGAKIPDLTGKKDWGTYEIFGLKIDTIEVKPEHLAVDVSKGVQITISKVVAKFGRSAGPVPPPRTPNTRAGARRLSVGRVGRQLRLEVRKDNVP